MKKGVIIVILLIILTSLILGSLIFNKEQNSEKECLIDSDCVPSSCCHANSCVPISENPNCNGIYCTQECAPETLDCGQASCACVNNKCSVTKK